MASASSAEQLYLLSPIQHKEFTMEVKLLNGLTPVGGTAPWNVPPLPPASYFADLKWQPWAPGMGLKGFNGEQKREPTSRL